MGKKIGLKQMYQKVFKEYDGFTPQMKESIGDVDDTFDVTIWGGSSNGKTNLTLELTAQLCNVFNSKAIYISWEEGHGKSLRDAIVRHNLLERLGNKMEIMDGGTFEEIDALIGKRKSAKIFVFDSIQACDFTKKQFLLLREKYIGTRKKKIFIYISWEKGSEPDGATAGAVKYMSHLKWYVKNFICFCSGRFGGKKNYVIWDEGAIKKWGKKLFNKHKNS